MTSFVDLTDDEAMAEIHAAYSVVPVLAAEDFIAGLTRGTLLDREADSEAAVDAYASAVLDADDGAFFAAAVNATRLFTATMRARRLCGLPDSGPVSDDFDEHGNGGLFLAPDAWPIGDASADFDLGALATALYEDGAA